MPHYKLKEANFRVFLDSKQGGRKYMEDVLMIREHKSEDGTNDFVFWGVFDGHGGTEAAKFAREHLLDELQKIKGFWSQDPEQVTRAIKEAFVNTHKLMWKNVGTWPKTVSGLPSTAGTTASIVFIKNGKMYIAHVGDSSVVIGEEKATWQRYIANLVTVDHKPEDPQEKKRIEESGGQVMCKAGVQRVVWHRPKPTHKGPVRRSTHIDDIPFLAVARALGDLWSYNTERDTFVVSPEPDITVYDFDPKKHKFVILASDGLWNMVGAEQAVAMVEELDESEAHLFTLASNPARKLVSHALDRWAMRHMRADNTSVIVAMIDAPGVDPSPGAHTNDRQPSSSSTVQLSDSDSAEVLNSPVPFHNGATGLGSWSASPVHFGLGRLVKPAQSASRTPSQHRHKHTRLRTPHSAPTKTHWGGAAGRLLKPPGGHGTPLTACTYPPNSAALGASPVLPKKAPSDTATDSLLASPAGGKRRASDDVCHSAAKKLRRSAASDDTKLDGGRDSSQTDCPKAATCARSPLKVDTQHSSPSMALVSPIWPSCLDKDIDLDAATTTTDAVCGLPTTAGRLESSLDKSATTRPRVPGYNKRSRNHPLISRVFRQKAGHSQGINKLRVNALRLRSKRTIQIRNKLHRTRLQVRATISATLSARRS